MPQILSDSELPPWLLDKIERERDLIREGGSRFPMALGSPGLRVYRLGDGSSGWWAWDNGTGGVILDNGEVSLNYAELDVAHVAGMTSGRPLTDLEVAGLRVLIQREGGS